MPPARTKKASGTNNGKSSSRAKTAAKPKATAANKKKASTISDTQLSEGESVQLEFDEGDEDVATLLGGVENAADQTGSENETISQEVDQDDKTQPDDFAEQLRALEELRKKHNQRAAEQDAKNQKIEARFSKLLGATRKQAKGITHKHFTEADEIVAAFRDGRDSVASVNLDEWQILIQDEFNDATEIVNSARNFRARKDARYAELSRQWEKSLSARNELGKKKAKQWEKFMSEQYQQLKQQAKAMKNESLQVAQTLSNFIEA